MDAREIIIRPIISEKSYRAIDTNRYSFEVNYRANKPHIRAAVEEIFKVKVIGVQTINMKPKPKRRGRPRGHHPALEEGCGRACSGQSDRVLRRHVEEGAVRENGDKELQADIPRTQVRDYSCLRRDHEERAGEGAHRAGSAQGRSQQQRPHLHPASGRRSQASVQDHRFQARQGRGPRPGRLYRVRSQPQLPHRSHRVPRW